MKLEPSFEIGSISDQLEQLRRSETFSRSGRLFALLEFLVIETLNGRGDSLKELVIGDALYSRSSPYDPGIDSSVRVEARRLRRKLHEYYESDGRTSAVRISLPQGGYRPIFTFANVDDGSRALPGSTAPIGVDLAILPFRTLAGSEAYDPVADGLTDEVIFALEHGTSIQLAPRMLIFQFKHRFYSLPEAVEMTQARTFLYGSLRVTGSTVRTTIELSDSLGFALWSERFDGPLDEPIALEERLADEVRAKIPFELLHRNVLPPGPHRAPHQPLSRNRACQHRAVAPS
ncbi:hypothetical protein ACIPPQ_21415 [Sphingopyxis sp. LARHCG72]